MRITLNRSIAVLPVLLLVAAHPTFAELPERFSARYTLSAGNMTLGETTWSLEPVGDDRYLYQSVSEPTGIMALWRPDRVVERSEWRYHDDRLQPLDYSYERSGGRKDRHVRIAFDWERGLARNSLRGNAWEMQLPKGALDKLSYVLALMRDLADGKRDIRYEIADGGHLKNYQLDVLREERIETSLGPLDAIVVRRERKGKKRVTTLWCAPALSFLPVKIEHREPDGNTVILTIQEATGFSGVRESAPAAQPVLPKKSS